MDPIVYFIKGRSLSGPKKGSARTFQLQTWKRRFEFFFFNVPMSYRLAIKAVNDWAL